jgi:2-dehydropantoate 2-reductase
MQFLVYGAGAVGSVVGGLLSLNHHDVCLVGRDAHVDAITSGGLRIKSATAEYHAHPNACSSLPTGTTTECVVLGVKSQDIPAAMDMLAPAPHRGNPRGVHPEWCEC